MKNTTMFFVMDGPAFESGAMLLASSMRAEFGSDVRIEACVPTQSLDDITPTARAIMDRLEVIIRPFNTFNAAWGTPYPHGNKILAACLPRATKSAVFFDTDTLVTGPFNLRGLGQNRTVLVVPEAKPSWGRFDTDWEPVYDMFDLPMPTDRVTLFRGRRMSVLPYYNAGLVGFSLEPGPDGWSFPELWLDTALRIDRNKSIPNQRPWLDQIALPVAATRFDARMDIRGEDYNFCLFNRAPSGDHDIRMMHYHQACVFRAWPECVTIGLELLDTCKTEEERDAVMSMIRPFLHKRGEPILRVA